MLLVSFYTPKKYQKTRGFLIFSGGIERDQYQFGYIYYKKSLMENFFWEGGGCRGGCITAGGSILASGNISLKLFMAPLETTELLTFWYVVTEHHFPQL